MTRTISALLALFLASACGVKKNIAGTYQLERFPKTILKINSDSTFECLKNNPNPYLHPSDPPDEYYWNTKGKWTVAGKKTLLLTSQTDTMIYPLVTVTSIPAILLYCINLIVMKKKWLPVLLILFASPLFAQNNNTGSLTLLDADMNEVRLLDSAKYFLNIRRLNDTTWRHDYYQLTGPRWRSETFKDEEGTKPHGRFAFYNTKGYIDSVGDAINGKRHGTWRYYVPNGNSIKMIMYKEYDNGKMLKEKDFRVKSTEKEEDDKNEYKEATFKGFKKFLEENLQFPNRALSMDLGDVVMVDFEVDENGSIFDPVVMRSIEHSLDREVERVISLSSGRWKPGLKNKIPVTTFHRQPISFTIIEED